MSWFFFCFSRKKNGNLLFWIAWPISKPRKKHLVFFSSNCWCRCCFSFHTVQLRREKSDTKCILRYIIVKSSKTLWFFFVVIAAHISICKICPVTLSIGCFDFALSCCDVHGFHTHLRTHAHKHQVHSIDQIVYITHTHWILIITSIIYFFRGERECIDFILRFHFSMHFKHKMNGNCLQKKCRWRWQTASAPPAAAAADANKKYFFMDSFDSIWPCKPYWHRSRECEYLWHWPFFDRVFRC